MAASLQGKVALVTGASRGIGEAIATTLAGAGARVVLASRSGHALETVAARIVKAGGSARVLVLDVTDSAAVDRALDGMVQQEGHLDLVVNNAGLSERGTVRGASDAWFDRVVKANLQGTFYVCRAALRHMNSGGRIVNIASVLGVMGVPDSAAYVAAKHAVVGLSRALAAEVARDGITVNAVCPGWVETPMAESGFAAIAEASGISREQARSKALANVPVGRILDPKEIAETVAFLCQPDAGGINGQTIRIDGGTTPW